jgi:hypothetical protein
MSQNQHNDLKDKLMAQDGIVPGQLPRQTRKEIDTMIEKVNRRARNAKHRMIAAWVITALLYVSSRALFVMRPASGIFPDTYAIALIEVATPFLILAIVLTVVFFFQSRAASLTEISARLARLEILLEKNEHD